ncbi:MAG: hypothetical protein MUO34_15015 [Ignavibacteriaceae bacterium]|nr:hypothetical protein [Ignavibacteriaceae bacterium]
MKAVSIISLTIIILLTLSVYAQDINVHTVIGKNQSEVVKKFGNPVHKDDSNQAMVCMFYKSNNRTMVFVADKDGVYQAEASAFFENEQTARNKMDEFISESIKNEFSADTVSVSDFCLYKKGVKVDLQLSENKISKKYEIKVKANRTED